jgi:hypothetical protein
MTTPKTIGTLLLAGAIGVLIPYSILTFTFQYPEILRQDTGTILTRFHEGGSGLVFTWWAFAILGLPLLVAYIMIGQQFEKKLGFVRWVTTIGIISGITQIIGLLRWVFVIPVLANTYVTTNNTGIKSATIVSFNVIHQFGGVLLGEHIGQLFTVIWTIMMSYGFIRLRYMPVSVGLLGISSAIIYGAAQFELFATIIPAIPYWGFAGFAGSTLWLIWLIILGILYIRKNKI